MAMTLGSQVQAILARHLESMQGGRNQIGPPRHLQKAVESFRNRYGGLGMGHIPQNRLERAIMALRRQGVAALSRGSRFILAHSLARPISQLGGDSILARADLALPLIACWEAEFRKGTLSPLHWKGLFHSYLQSPAVESTNSLRVLLLRSMATTVVKHRIKPLWLELIERHRHLLGGHPCGPYVQELLGGGREKLDDLKKGVSLPEGSWFWWAMTRALVDEIRGMPDDRFRRLMGRALGFANAHPAARDPILTAILDRYAKLAHAVRNEALLRVAVDAWGSPQRPGKHLWESVEPSTKRMVCTWLGIEDFNGR